MNTMHGNCTGICATESQYWRAFREIAHITHYILKRNYLTTGYGIYICITATSSLAKTIFKIRVQCVQIAKSIGRLRLRLHRYMCAHLSSSVQLHSLEG